MYKSATVTTPDKQNCPECEGMRGLVCATCLGSGFVVIYDEAVYDADDMAADAYDAHTNEVHDDEAQSYSGPPVDFSDIPMPEVTITEPDGSTWEPLHTKLMREYADVCKRYAAAAAAGALALALSVTPASAKLSHDEATPIIDALTPLVPVGCALQHVWEDFTGDAVCAGGYVVWVNAQHLGDKESDIPYPDHIIRVGPDSNGLYHDFTIMD